MKQTIPFKKDIIFKTKISDITSISLEFELDDIKDKICGNFIVSGDYKMTEASINKEEFNYKIPFQVELDERYDLDKVKVEIDDFYYEIVNNDVLRANIDLSIENLIEKEVQEIKEESVDEEEIEELVRELNEIKEDVSSSINNTDEIEEIIFENNMNNRNLSKENETEQQMTVYSPINNNRNLHIQNQNIEISNSNNMIKDDTEFVNNEEKENKKMLEVSTNEIKGLFNLLNDEEEFKTYHVYIFRENDSIDSIINKYNITQDLLKEYNDLEDIKLGDKLIIPYCHNEQL